MSYISTDKILKYLTRLSDNDGDCGVRCAIYEIKEWIAHNVEEDGGPVSLNEWAAEIHGNAVIHGWWEEDRSFAEVVALCHSELSEALEADRAGEPMVWHKNGKPEGAAVELMDCVIRILDWFGYADINAEEVLKDKHEYNITRPYKHGKKY